MNPAISLVEPQIETDNLRQEALTLPEQAKALLIVDQITYNHAAEMFNAASQLAKKIEAHYKPLKDKAFAAHKAVVSAEKEMLGPVVTAKQILSGSIGTWDVAQERRQYQEQLRLELEAKKKAEDNAIKLALEVLDKGASEKQAIEIIDTPVAPTKIEVAPAYTKAATVSTQEIWSAELTDVYELVKAAAVNPVAYLHYLEVNTPALNAAARNQKNKFNVPGVYGRRRIKRVVRRIAKTRSS